MRLLGPVVLAGAVVNSAILTTVLAPVVVRWAFKVKVALKGPQLAGSSSLFCCHARPEFKEYPQVHWRFVDCEDSCLSLCLR